MAARAQDHVLGAPVRRHVLRDEVQDMILRRLLEARWAPGSRLSIDGLARDLKVSPTPVREALVSLERSGLVEYVALRGYVVAPMLTPEQVTALLEARIVVETAVLSQAFEHWDEFVRDLEAAHASHSEAVERVYSAGEVSYELLQEHFHFDWAFHQTYFKHAGNPYLSQVMEMLQPHTHRMRQTWEGGPTVIDAREALAEHGQVLAMVRQHNHDGALRALTEHLNNVQVRSLAIIRDGAIR